MWGVGWGGGGEDKHTRSTEPAQRRRACVSTRMHTTTQYMDSPAHIVAYVMRHTRHICHETYTPTSTDKRIHANTCAHIYTNIHREAHMSTRMHARQAFCKKRSRSDPFARSLSEPFARRLSDPLPYQGPTKHAKKKTRSGICHKPLNQLGHPLQSRRTPETGSFLAPARPLEMSWGSSKVEGRRSSEPAEKKPRRRLSGT